MRHTGDTPSIVTNMSGQPRNVTTVSAYFVSVEFFAPAIALAAAFFLSPANAAETIDSCWTLDYSQARGARRLYVNSTLRTCVVLWLLVTRSNESKCQIR